MAKLNNARLRILRAADRGDLRHSVYGGYDWIDLNHLDDGGRVTPAVKAALRDEHIELRPRRRGDEHRGQEYKLTDAGRAALADHDAKTKEA